MISWKIASSEVINDWHFPSFEMQEYILPIINVGGQSFDEYGQTKYSIEDCRRLRSTVAFAKETLALTSKTEIRYETIHKGLVSFVKAEIVSVLDCLDKAASYAIKQQSSLLFLGD